MPAVTSARTDSPSGSTCTARTPTACWPTVTPITASVRPSNSRPIVRRPLPRACRHATPDGVARCRWRPFDARRAAGEPAVVRFRVPEHRDVTFDDVVRGPVTINTDVIGDPVLLRSDGHPAYNFAVVVDDGLMGVTTVVRGEDHIPNTPRQVLLYEAFGWTPPAFAHLSLVLGPDHAPLSKRHGATSVVEFRNRGYLPEALVNYLALVGWSPGGGDELLPLDELARRFSLDGVSHSAGVFDVEKLAWVNRHYLKSADRARLCALSLPYLREAGLATTPGERGARLADGHPADGHRCRGSAGPGAGTAGPGVQVRRDRGAGPRGCAGGVLRRRRSRRGAGARRRPGVGAPARRPRPVSRGRAARPREDRAEGQGAVPSHPRRADRTPRGP